jgi:hypothetical protein
MSVIAIGATVATGAAVTAGTVAAGATLAATAYGAYANNKASKQAAASAGAGGLALDPRALAEIMAGVSEYNPVDVAAVASRTANQNAGEGVTLANRSAKKINAQAVSDVIDAMNKLYGGEKQYQSQQSSVLAAISDSLAGKVSSSTRADLGRRMLASGVSELGEGAADDIYGGYLGLTREQITAQGQEQFKSLYSTWRQSVPLISAANILDRFTMAPGEAVDAEIQNAMNEHQSSLGVAGLKMQALGMGYGAQMNQFTAAQGAAQQRRADKQAQTQMLISAVGTAAGAYSASRPAATNTAGLSTTAAAMNTTQQAQQLQGGGRPISQQPTRIN